MSTVMSRQTGYVLSDSGSELDRLRVQARFWERDAETMLGLIGVQPGWQCLDLGCGAMGILRSLSHAVGPEGSVIGLDNDPRLLAAARKWADTQPGMGNVSLTEGDAFRTGLPRASFDLVHARFMFAPLGTSDALFREMLALTKPGGVVAIQEPIASSWRFYPSRPPVERLIAAILSAFQSGGGNFDAGRGASPCSDPPASIRCRRWRSCGPFSRAIRIAGCRCSSPLRSSSGSSMKDCSMNANWAS
jgi:SAM-dependent methyltransferase